MKNLKVLTFILVAVVFVAIPFLGACAAPTPPPPEEEKPTPEEAALPPKPEGTLTLAVPTLGNETFLPDKGASDKIYWNLIYDWLLYQKHDSFERIPGLAERWEMSADGLSWTLYLRKGVQWHDGWGELTAEDVKYTIEEIIMAEGSASPLLRTFRSFIKQIEILDPYTITLHLTGTDVYFDSMLAYIQFAPIVCKKYIETVGIEEASLKPVGSGPFKLVEHNRGVSMKLEAVEDHWRVVPEFKYIEFKIVLEQTTRLAMLKKGEVDITDILAEQVEEVKEAGANVRIFPGQIGHSIFFGGMIPPGDDRYDPAYHGKDPWMDKRVREAMIIAINRQEICQYLFFGQAEPKVVGWEYTGYEVLEPYPYDPERAKALLAEADYPDGFELEFWSAVVEGYPSQLVDEAIATYWENIGIKVKIKPADSIFVLAPDFFAGKTAGAVIGFRTQAGANWTNRIAKEHIINAQFGWSQDEQIDAWYHNEILGELDTEKLASIYARIAKRLYDEYLIVPVVRIHGCLGVSDKVGDWPQFFSIGRPNYLEYATHPVPLDTFRLDECEP